MTYTALFLTFLPLTLLLWLAHIADKQRAENPEKKASSILVTLLLGLMWLVTAVGGVFLLLLGVAYHRYADIDSLTNLYNMPGMNPDEIIQIMQALPKIGAGLVVLAVVGWILLLPPTRRLLARLIPLNPNNATGATALAFSVLILVNMWLIMGIGMEATATMVTAAPDTPAGQVIAQIWLQNLLMAFMAFIGVGWLSRRSWSQTLQRLGLTWSGWRTAGLGVLMGLAVFLLIFPLEMLLDKAGLSADPSVEALTEKLIGPLMDSLLGIITLGAAAALGEELVFRGALQPKFGIVLTSALFALMHSQYGLSSATLLVFVVGLILGWTRKQTNTTTAIFLHATYNISIGLASFLFH